MAHTYNLLSLPVSQINFSDPLFDSVKADYEDFDQWLLHAHRTSDSRIAFVALNSTSEYAGIAICKVSPAQNRLKISTFKVAAIWTGYGLGNSLLGQIIAHAVTNMIRVIVTRIPATGDDAIRFFERAGFRRQPGLSHRGEYIYALDLNGGSRSFSAINRIAYDQLADEYLIRSCYPTASQESPQHLSRSLTKLLPKGTKRPILELGPGAGDVLAALANDGWNTVAVELSSRMAAIARSKSPTSTIIIADILEVDFPHDTFAGVYASAFFHLFPKVTAIQLISRAATWIDDGGLIFINTTVADKSDEGLDLKMDYLRKIARYRAYWSEVELLEMIELGGLKVIERLTTAEVDRSKDWVAFICAAI